MTDPENDDSLDPENPFPDPFVIPIEESIDLHLFRPSEIGDVVEGYLEAAIEKRFREVRLIHGRGKGVQRDRVQRLLLKHPGVERFADAPGDRGGWGATIAWLRVPDDPQAS
jgi:dsDNA-specific endonuclease/ATPase MutS2